MNDFAGHDTGPVDGPLDEGLVSQDQIQPGDHVIELIDGVPYVQTAADDVDAWRFT